MPCRLKTVLLAALILLSGCALQQGKTLKRVPPPPKTGEELLALIEERNGFTETLEGRLSSKIVTVRGKKSSTQLILLKKPSLMRIDVLTPFGSPALSMSTDGNDVTLHYHFKKRFFSGDLRSGKLSTLFASTLEMKDLATILGGGIPLISHGQGESTVSLEGDFYRLDIKNGSAREEIFFEPETLAPARGVIYDAMGNVVLLLEMSKHEEVQGFSFPMKIALSLPIENYEMQISYSTVALNDYTGIDAFRLAAPEGAVVEDVETLNL